MPIFTLPVTPTLPSIVKLPPPSTTVTLAVIPAMFPVTLLTATVPVTTAFTLPPVILALTLPVIAGIVPTLILPVTPTLPDTLALMFPEVTTTFPPIGK